MNPTTLAELIGCVLWTIYRILEMEFTKKCMGRKFTDSEAFTNVLFTFFGLLAINGLIIIGSWG